MANRLIVIYQKYASRLLRTTHSPGCSSAASGSAQTSIGRCWPPGSEAVAQAQIETVDFWPKAVTAGEFVTENRPLPFVLDLAVGRI